MIKLEGVDKGEVVIINMDTIIAVTKTKSYISEENLPDYVLYTDNNAFYVNETSYNKVVEVLGVD